MKPELFLIGIALFVTACASLQRSPEVAALLATQLHQLVNDTKALNEELSEQVDAWDEWGISVRTLKRHPQFASVYSKAGEAAARTFVDPSLKETLINELAATLSEDEVKIVLKIVELHEQRHQLVMRWEALQNQSSLLNERWKALSSRVIVELGTFTTTEQAQVLSLMQDRVSEVERMKRHQESLKQTLTDLAHVWDK
jgi:hypothetical protein